MQEAPAIEGGMPVREDLLPYGHQWLDDEDVAAVVEVLRDDWLTQGPKVDEFERRVADYCSARFGVAMCNGTAALHAACAVAGIAHGDEVVTTPMSFAASANAVVYCGGRPKFADIREDTLNIDPREVRKAISPRTKAIIPVDFGGHPADLDEIRAIAEENSAIVVEDACHALGANYKGRRIGGLADMTALSFHPVKHIATGEGGMVLTNSEELYQKLRTFRHHGIEKPASGDGPWYYEIQVPGHNFRITDIQCALGISQLSKLQRFVERRREIAKRYDASFVEMDEVVTPVEADHVHAVYHLYPVRLRPVLLRVDRKRIFEALRAENIGVQVHYLPIHLHPFYQREFAYHRGDFPKAEEYYDTAITLPLFPRMSDSDVETVIRAVKKVVGFYRTRKAG